MRLLKKIRNTNRLAALKGTTFVTPYFRKAFGQYPYDIESIEFSQKNLGKKIRQTIFKRDKPFVAIVHDKNKNQIVDVFYVPLVKTKDNKIKIV